MVNPWKTWLFILLTKLAIGDDHAGEVGDVIVADDGRPEILYFEWIKATNSKDFRTYHADLIGRFRDPSVDPCDNFFQYACGNWNKWNPNNGATCSHNARTVLSSRIEKLLQEFVKSEIQSSDSESVVKMKQFYTSCMNTEEIEARGMKPLLKFLMDLGSWPILNREWSSADFSWLSTVSKAKTYGLNVFINQYVSYNRSDFGAKTYDLYLGCDHYHESVMYERGFHKFKDYLRNNSFYTEQFGINSEYFDQTASELIEFNKKLLEIPCDRVNHMRMDFTTLREKVPEIDWQEYFSIVFQRPMNPRETIIVYDLDHFKKLVQLIDETDPKIVADYIFVYTFVHLVQYINLPIMVSDRSEFCFSEVQFFMDLVLSKSYADHFFNEYKKAEVLSIVDDLQNYLVETINASAWLDEESKLEGVAKLLQMASSVGYTDLHTVEDLNKLYADIEIDPDKFFENGVQLFATANRFRQMLMGQVIDDSYITHEVKSRYMRFDRRDVIILPAAILQAPFYHEFIPRLLNYGSIGQMIGHEIMHAFDLKGGRFDSEGRQKTWYSENDENEFLENVACFASQFDIKVDDHESKDLVLTEILANSEGLKIAYGTFKQWLNDHPESPEYSLKEYSNLKLSPDQLFFLVYAQTECTRYDFNTTEPENIHKKGYFRVNGAVSNNNDFAKAFQCSTGSPMNPEGKCTFLF